jgi:branched-chain amino acid transport system substrate-binding protein
VSAGRPLAGARRLALALLCLLAAALAAGCGAEKGGGGGGGGREPIPIGAIADRTGPTAVTQTPFLHGIQAFVRKTNDAGGIGGRPIELMVEDEKYDVQAGLLAYKKLVNQERVEALAGSLNNSGFALSALKLIQRDKVPVIGSYSTPKEALTPFNPYFFATQCSYADQADVAVPYMAQKTGARQPRVAVIYLNVPSGEEWAALVKARVEKLGGTFLGATALPPTATEADAQVQRIAGQKPDFIALHGSSDTAVITLRSMQKLGMTKTPMIGIFATGSKNVYQAAPQATGQNFQTVNCFTPTDVKEPGTAAMVQAGRKYGFGKDVDNTNFVAGWVVGETLVAGLRKAGSSIDRQSILRGMEQVRDLDTAGLSPNVSFGPRDRAGIQVVRPYRYDYATKQLVAVGDYADYERYISNEYLPTGGGE